MVNEMIVERDAVSMTGPIYFDKKIIELRFLHQVSHNV